MSLSSPAKPGNRSHTRAGVALALCGLLVTGASTASRADPVADFYRGKTLSLVSGFSPNGEFDTYFRIFGRHVSRHVPGRPQVVSSSMPGAGTMILANHLFKIAPADGSFVGMFAMQVAVEPFLKNKAAMFDPLKFNWIGSLTQDQHFCSVVPGPGVPDTFEGLLRKDTREILFGGAGSSSEIHRLTAPLKHVLGARIRIVSGYTGMPPIKLALERGELEGVCGLTTAALQRQHRPQLSSGKLKLLVQVSGPPTSEFGKIPSVFDFARDAGQRELLEFYYTTLTFGRPIAVPPGVPADRLAALRAAFTATLADKDFLDEAKQFNMDVAAIHGDEFVKVMDRLSKAPEAFFEKAREGLE